MKTERGAGKSQPWAAACCGPSGTGGWAPPLLVADTPLKRCVDKLLPRRGVAVAGYFAVVIGLLLVAARFPPREQLAVEGLAALAAGSWCALNFWRSRHGHCMITGPAWLLLAVFTFAEAAIGRSLVDGDEQRIFLAVLVVGCGFECWWYLARGTNAVTPTARTISGGAGGR